MQCSSAHVNNVHVLPDCWLGQHASTLLGSLHGGTKSYTKSLHIEKAQWNPPFLYIFSVFIYVSFLTSVTQWCMGGNSQFQTHTHTYSYTIAHAELCMAGHKDWGLYTCSWRRHLSLSPLLILFHLPWKEWELEREKKMINFMSALHSGFRQCLISSYFQPHTHSPGWVNVCKAVLVFDLA